MPNPNPDQAVRFAPLAAANLNHAYEHDEKLADAYDGWLDLLETNPKDTALRRHEIGSRGIWVITITIPGRDTRYVIYWRFEKDGAPKVHHLGSEAP